MKIDPLTIQFLQHYFDKIYVITIKRAVERQQQVKHQLDGLPFEFFYGVDKQNLDNDIMDNHKKNQMVNRQADASPVAVFQQLF